MKRLASLAAFGVITLMPQQALAFDCKKASTEVEKAICADPALNKLDDGMSAAYASVKAVLQPKDPAHFERVLKARAACPWHPPR